MRKHFNAVKVSCFITVRAVGSVKLSVKPPLLSPIRVHNGRAVGSVTLSVKVPCFITVRFHNGRAVGSVKFSVKVPLLSPIRVHNGRAIESVKLVVGVAPFTELWILFFHIVHIGWLVDWLIG